MARNSAALTVVTDVDRLTVQSVAVAATMSRRALLLALQGKLAQAIDDGPADRDLKSLTRELTIISKELEGMTAGEDGDEVGNAAATPDEPWTG